LELTSSFGLQNRKTLSGGNKGLENRRHVGLGQEATGLNKNRRYADLKKWRHAGLRTGGNQPQNEGSRSLRIKGF